MRYRQLPKSPSIKLSEIGFGAGPLKDCPESDELLKRGLEAGINFMDLLPAEVDGYEPFRRVIAPVREHVYIQMHLGCTFKTGTYGWTRDLEEIKCDWQRQLDAFDTTYADFGFIHCMDDVQDFEEMHTSGLWDFALELKDSGAIRHLGCSTHSVEVAKRFLETGLIELMMFSINPMYDYTDESEWGKGGVDERAELYRLCEVSGVAISVMKCTAGGQLLDAAQSPFKMALTPIQCAQYALDKPAVVSVLPGVKSVAELESFLALLDASAEERDYSVLGTVVPEDLSTRCVYCSHCHPCPQGLNIALINKYYDLALMGDTQAANHYDKLDLHASDCIACGHCNSRCPFDVDQQQRMKQIASHFGK